MDRSRDDLIQPFQLEGARVRGHVVRLGPAVDEVLGRHHYPEPVSRVLGEAVALAALLSASLKFDGIFTLQIQADGPVSLLVADYRTGGDLRAMAKFESGAVAAVAADAALPDLMGKGHLAFTVDQGEDTERYQGIVDLVGGSLAACAQSYFRRSEQIATAISLAAGIDPAGHWRAGGMLMQQMPDERPVADGDDVDTETKAEFWREAVVLMASVGAGELIDPDLGPNELLFRLFHETGVWVHETRDLEARCRCSRERVENVLRSFPADQIVDMADDGVVTVTCEFCNQAYCFAATDF